MDISFISDITNQWAPWFLQHGVRILLIILVAIFLSSLVRRLMSHRLRVPSIIDNIPRPKYKNIITAAHQRRIGTVLNAVKDTLSFLIFIVAVLTILPEFGVNVGPILAGLGLVGLALGMGAKDLITDFLAGFFLIIEGEINIGDKAKIGDAQGKVVAISLRRTVIQGKDGSVYLIPNREIKMIKRYAVKKDNLK